MPSGSGSASPFIIMGLPRSRTAWLSAYLTDGNWTCGHEELRHVRDLDDVRCWLGQEFIGSAETLAAPWWRLLLELRPDIRLVLIRRDPEAVVRSFLELPGLTWNEAGIRKQVMYLNGKLDQIEKRVWSARSFRYESLVRDDVCEEIWRLTRGDSWDRGRWRRFNQTNVQVSVPAMVRYVMAFKAKLAKAEAEAKTFSISLLKDN